MGLNDLCSITLFELNQVTCTDSFSLLYSYQNPKLSIITTKKKKKKKKPY
ncbi:hypothetical protein HanIR_Chr03g0100451 [Helianthus annuus]|nr:hypothetical protein HanIR_Chr03g0100451 [Helianthus annuus]